MFMNLAIILYTTIGVWLQDPVTCLKHTGYIWTRCAAVHSFLYVCITTNVKDVSAAVRKPDASEQLCVFASFVPF